VAKSATGPRFKDKPVKPGDEMDVTISEMSKKGDGVTKVQGYVIFIPRGSRGSRRASE